MVKRFLRCPIGGQAITLALTALLWSASAFGQETGARMEPVEPVSVRGRTDPGGGRDGADRR